MTIRTRLVTDEDLSPVAVQIDYQDWLEIQRLLAETGAPITEAGEPGSKSLRGSVLKYEDPFGPAVPDTDWDALR